MRQARAARQCFASSRRNDGRSGTVGGLGDTAAESTSAQAVGSQWALARSTRVGMSCPPKGSPIWWHPAFHVLAVSSGSYLGCSSLLRGRE